MEERLGRYRLVRKLATGGMAEVFLAVAEGPEGFEKTVVLKRVLPHFAEDPRFAAMFLDEARLAARLDHPNIVQIFDLGQADGRYFLAMEYLRGAPLSKVLRALRAADRDLPHPLASFVVARAATALHHAHRLAGPDGAPLGLVHRDVSPDNLFVTEAGVVKVLDFGIAKAATNRHETTAGTVKGKFAYMSPEQVRGLPLDARSDVFSLGVVLYELTTRVRPFGGASDLMTVSAILNDPPPLPTASFPGYDPALESVCLRCLEKDRDARWPSAGDLAAALDALAARSGPASEAALARFLADLDVGSDPATGAPATPSSPPPAATAALGTPGHPSASTSASASASALPAPAPSSRTPAPGATALLPPSPEPPAAPAAPRRSRTPLALALALLAVLAAAGAAAGWFLLATDDAPTPSPPSSASASSPPSAPAPAPAPSPAPAPIPTAALLDLRTHPNFQVAIDGRPRSVGSHRMALAPGRHRIDVTGPHFSRTDELDLVPGADPRVLEVLPAEGRLVLKASRGTRVLLDGRPVGTAPFRAPVATWEGLHTVRFEPRSGPPVTRTVVLTPRTPRLTVTGP